MRRANATLEVLEKPHVVAGWDDVVCHDGLLLTVHRVSVVRMQLYESAASLRVRG